MKIKKGKLLTREQLMENFGNPILDPGIFGGTSGNPFFFNSDPCNNNILSPNSVFGQGGPTAFPCDDIITNPPAFADPSTVVRPGEKLLLGATIINGMPLTPWGSMFIGSVEWSQKNVMGNAMWIDQIVQKVYPLGIGGRNSERLEFQLNELKILKMSPKSSGIGLSITIEFSLKFDNEEEMTEPLIAKFQNWPMTSNDDFVCEPLNNFSKEDYIKVMGQIKNALTEWFKPRAGVYVFCMKELIIWNELGQVNRLHEGDQVEVIQSTESKISFLWKDVKWQLKSPSLWWFNWHFNKK